MDDARVRGGAARRLGVIQGCHGIGEDMIRRETTDQPDSAGEAPHDAGKWQGPQG